MYQNVNTGEVWKLSHVETIRTWRNEIKVYLKIYVFENGERWAEDLFFKYWRNVGEAQQKMHLTLGESSASDSESKPAPKQVI